MDQTHPLVVVGTLETGFNEERIDRVIKSPDCYSVVIRPYVCDSIHLTGTFFMRFLNSLNGIIVEAANKLKNTADQSLKNKKFVECLMNIAMKIANKEITCVNQVWIFDDYETVKLYSMVFLTATLQLENQNSPNITVHFNGADCTNVIKGALDKIINYV